MTPTLKNKVGESVVPGPAALYEGFVIVIMEDAYMIRNLSLKLVLPSLAQSTLHYSS